MLKFLSLSGKICILLYGFSARLYFKETNDHFVL